MMNSPLNDRRTKQRPITESDLIIMHHNFMMVYGWIPIAEFKKIPLPTFLALAKKVDEEIARRENLRLNTLKSQGVKNPK